MSGEMKTGTNGRGASSRVAGSAIEDPQRKGHSTLRVAFVGDAILGRNGVGTYYTDLLSHLEERVEAAALLCPNGDAPEPHQWWSVPLPGDSTQRLSFPRGRTLRRQLRQLAPHVVVAPTPGPYGLIGCRFAARQGIPVCIGYQTDYEKLLELYWHPLFARPSRRVMRSVQGWFFRRGSVVVTISDHMAVRVREAGIANIRLIGTPIGKEFLAPQDRPIGKELKRVLFLGRLALEKNIGEFIQAAADLPDIDFYVAGEGPLRSLVETKSKSLPNLYYLGWLTRKDVVAALDNSDMLVLPSSVEAFGTVAIEAMARQRLVLTSRHCGIVKWPELAEGILTAEAGESFTDAVRRVQNMTSDERQRKALTAREAAKAVNVQTIDTWVDLLWQLANRGNDTPAQP